MIDNTFALGDTDFRALVFCTTCGCSYWGCCPTGHACHTVTLRPGANGFVISPIPLITKKPNA